MTKENSKLGRINALWIGIKGGIISSICCIPVIILVPILVLLGAESFTIAFALTKYRIPLIILGSLFVLISLRLSIRKRYGYCNAKTVLKNRYIIAVALLTQISFFLISYYVILPAISNYVFTRDLEEQEAEPIMVTTTISTTTIPETTSSTTTTTIEETCFDGIRNQNEERVDCGGVCGECGTIGVTVNSVGQCSDLEYNALYVSLTDYGVGSRKWMEKTPKDSFQLFCDNESVKNFFRLERRFGDNYVPTNMYVKNIVGEYVLLVACKRKRFIEDISECKSVSVNVSSGKYRGFGTLTKSTEITTTSTTTSTTSTTVTTTIEPRFVGYEQVTLKLNTYCPTCVPAAKYLLTNTKGVISAKFPDPKKKLWIITYNQSVTDPHEIMSNVRDFDPVIV